MDTSNLKTANRIFQFLGISILIIGIGIVLYFEFKPKPKQTVVTAPKVNVITALYSGGVADERVYNGVASSAPALHFYSETVKVNLMNSFPIVQKINPNDFTMQVNGASLLPISAEFVSSKSVFLLYPNKTDTLVLTYTSSSDIRSIPSLYIQSSLYYPYTLPIK